MELAQRAPLPLSVAHTPYLPRHSLISWFVFSKECFIISSKDETQSPYNTRNSCLHLSAYEFLMSWKMFHFQNPETNAAERMYSYILSVIHPFSKFSFSRQWQSVYLAQPLERTATASTMYNNKTRARETWCDGVEEEEEEELKGEKYSL